MIEKLRQKLAPLPAAGFNVAAAGAGSIPAPEAERRHPHPWLLWTLVAAMVVLWSINLPVGKVALRSFPPLLLISVRTVIACGMMLPIYLMLGRGAPPFDRRDLPALAALSLLGQIGNQMMFVTGLNHTSVGHAAFLLSTSPVAILLLAAWRGMERLRGAKLMGMGVSAAGVVLLSQEKASAGGPTLLGDLLTLGASFAFAAFTVAGKRYRRRYGAIPLNMLAYLCGAVALLPVVMVYSRTFEFSAVPLEGWLSLLYMAAFPAVICYAIYFYALGYVPASRLAVLGYLQPLIATTTGVMWLGEPVTPLLLAAGGVILLGVFLAEKR